MPPRRKRGVFFLLAQMICSKISGMTKVLLLGLGRWGANHLRNLNSMPVELYVAEVGAKQLEPARKLGLPAERLTTNYQDFIGRVDGVVIVTPAQSHFALCREFLEAGKDVFVEKPLTLAERRSQATRRTGRPAQTHPAGRPHSAFRPGNLVAARRGVGRPVWAGKHGARPFRRVQAPAQ